jgi:hypothetical protein
VATGWHPSCLKRAKQHSRAWWSDVASLLQAAISVTITIAGGSIEATLLAGPSVEAGSVALVHA